MQFRNSAVRKKIYMLCSDNLHGNWQSVLYEFLREAVNTPYFFSPQALTCVIMSTFFSPNLFWIVKKIQFQLIRPLSVSIMVQKLTLPVQYTNMYTMDLQCRFILQ